MFRLLFAFSFVFAVNYSVTALARSVSLPLFLLFDITEAHSVSQIVKIFLTDIASFDSCRELAVLLGMEIVNSEVIDVIFFPGFCERNTTKQVWKDGSKEMSLLSRRYGRKRLKVFHKSIFFWRFTHFIRWYDVSMLAKYLFLHLQDRDGRDGQNGAR